MRDLTPENLKAFAVEKTTKESETARVCASIMELFAVNNYPQKKCVDAMLSILLAILSAQDLSEEQVQTVLSNAVSAYYKAMKERGS